MTDEAFLYELQFLLTPLREGRPAQNKSGRRRKYHFYSRPCGRGDPWHACDGSTFDQTDFYSRPCGRGDLLILRYNALGCAVISTHAPAGGATARGAERYRRSDISTHAPAGGATQSLFNLAIP